MEVRKIQYQGRSTYTVSLPKKWVKRLDIKKGDKIVFNYTENHLILQPLECKNKEKEINVDKDLISRNILTAYLAGFKSIRLSSSKAISPEMKNEIERIVAKLKGLQIDEESSNEILLQDLLDPKELDIRKTVKKAYCICASMHKDAILALKENDKELARDVIQRDNTVDRLYFLMVRLSMSIDQQYGITETGCLDCRMLAKYIERIADSCCIIANKTTRLDKGYDIGEFSDLCYKMHEQAFAAYLSKNMAKAQELRKKRRIILEAKENLPEPKISPILDELVSIAKNGVDIADLVI